MKITMQQDKEKLDIEVTIVYPELNQEVELIKRKICGISDSILGEVDGRRYAIRLYDIFYIESVERKTFIYTKEQVFRSELKLYQLQEKLPIADFERVSKSCILNLNVLDSVVSLPNSKLEAVLVNGEKIVISRTYLSAIRKKLKGE